MAYMRDHKITPEILSPMTKDEIEDNKDRYFNELKSKMFQSLQKEGYNDEQIKLVLDGGIYEFSKDMAVNKIKQNIPGNQNYAASLPNKNQNSIEINKFQKNLGHESDRHLEVKKKQNKYEEKKEIYL